MRTPSMSKMMASICGIEEGLCLVGEISAEEELIRMDGGPGFKGGPEIEVFALVEFRRDQGDAFARGEVGGDGGLGYPVGIEHIEPDAGGVFVEGGRGFDFRVA